MKTYNDLLECYTEDERTLFVKSAITDHESNPMFRTGRTAGEFYRHINKQLESITKVVYDRQGTAYSDDVSPNHKIVSNMFHFFTTQLVSYQLGNGVSFEDEKIKEALGGSDFDYVLQDILTYAACDGEAYGYVTESGVKPLCYACKVHGNEPLLAPLKDENDGQIKAAVQYWRLAPNKPLRATLYELDGFTEYKDDDEKGFSVLQPKRAYSQTKTFSKAEGITQVENKNYDRFPIVPMGFINGQSSIVGNENTLFAYDVVMSGMVNNVDMNTVYWIIKNADGMDKKDDMTFVADMIHNKVIHAPEDVDIRKEEIQSRQDAYTTVIAMLRQQLFTDFQAVDVQNISGASKTTVEIKAAYQNLNLKCDEVEKYISKFIRACLRVKGLDENAVFHFRRPSDINQTEMITTIMQISPLIGEDTALKLVCETLGMIDEYENIKAAKQADAMQQIALMQAQKQAQTIDKEGE